MEHFFELLVVIYEWILGVGVMKGIWLCKVWKGCWVFIKGSGLVIYEREVRSERGGFSLSSISSLQFSACQCQKDFSLIVRIRGNGLERGGCSVSVINFT